MNRNLNHKFYSSETTLDYYDKLAEIGLFKFEEKLINMFLSPNHNILDIGCGAGRVTLALHKKKYKVTGIDYSVKMIELAKKRNINVFVNDVTNLLFEDSTFDSCIFSFNGLMLIDTYEKREKAISEIRRVLKKHGIFIFTTPFLDDKIKTSYWSKKIDFYGIPLENMDFNQKLMLSDEILDEDDIDYYIHVPLLEEIYTLLENYDFKILAQGKRLEDFEKEEFEDLLDNNYYWVVSNEKD